MKTVMQLLSLLLCFEFIIAPVQGSLLINSAIAQDEGKTCPAGQVYEASVNRCLLKQTVIDQNNAVMDCKGDKSCYEKNAIKNSDGYSDKVEKNDLSKAGTAAAIAIPLVIVGSVLLEKRANTSGTKPGKENSGGSGSKFECKPPSLLLMYGAAAALGVGEIYGYFNHKGKLKKIQEQWDKSVIPKDGEGTDKNRVDATEAQSQAFEFLAQNEEQVAKTAKMKKGFYLAATGLFAAGATAAVIEMFQLASAKKALPLAISNLKLAQADSTKAAQIPTLKMEIQKHNQTIKRLSCFQDKTEVSDEGRTEEELKEEDANKAKTEAEAIAAADKQSAQIANEKAQIRASKEEIIKNSTDPEEVARLKEELAEEARIETRRLQNEKMNRESKEIQENLKKLKNKGSFIPKKELEKMKRVAAYNLSTAKNAEQYLNLIQEFESIEFENYSKVKYAEEDQSLQKIEFSPIVAKMIAEVLIPSSQAQSGLVGSLLPTMAMPLLNGMKGITNIIKFNNGKPMKASEMKEIKTRSTNFIIRAIAKPVTRLAINGVLGGWMGIVVINMNKQQHLAQDRAKKLRSMKEEFVTQGGLLFCKPEDRNDVTKPKCYCYTPENKINPARTATETCKNALATLNKNLEDTAGDKVCVSAAMAIDSNCACRAANNCLKTTAGFTTMGFSPNTFKMISANSGAANDLFNGTASAGDIADSAGINAARTQAAAAAAIAGDAAAVKESKAAASEFEKGLLAATSGLSMGSSSGSSPLPSSPAAAAAALDKEIKENNEEIDVTTSGPSNATNANFDSSEEVPEFGMSGADAANQEIEIAEVMGKEVDFGSNDINKTKETNLFETLSNRYQRSGMRRLFEDGKTAPAADAPAKSDISN